AELGITSSRDLARYAQDVVRDAGNAEANPNSVDNEVAHAEIIRAAAGTLPQGSEGAELLTDDTFVNALAAGSTPFEAATAVEAKEIYDETLKPTVEKPLSQWSPEDAENFTGALADAVEENSDNPTLVNQLLALSQGRLERTAEIIGTATEGNDYDGDTVEQLAANLSRVGNAAPEDGALLLAAALASQIDDDSELNKVDDGFKHAIEDGVSDRFRSMLNGALVEQGKNEAAEELREDGGGSSVGDRWGDAIHAVTEAAANQTEWALSGANAVYQAGGDALRGGLGRTLDVVDRGLAAVEAHGPSWARGAAGAGRRGVDGARAGLEFHNQLQETFGSGVVSAGTGAVRAAGGAIADPVGTHNAIVDGVRELYEATKLSEQIESLQPGDSVSFSGTVGGSGVNISAEATGEITVSRNDDGTYSVHADGTVGVGAESTGGAGAGYTVEGQVQAGIAADFELGSSADAATAVRSLLGNAGALQGLLEGSTDALTPDFELLKDSVTAVEVHGGAALDLAASLGVDLGPELEGQFSASNTATARIVLRPEPAFEASVEVEVSGGASATSGLAGVNAGAGASVNITQSFPIEGIALNPIRYLADPIGAARELRDHVINEGTTTVTVGTSRSGGASVGSGAAGVSGDATLAAEISFSAPTGVLTETISALVRGNFSEAHRALSASDEVTVNVSTSAEATTTVGGTYAGGDGSNSYELGLEATRTAVSEQEVYSGTYAETSDRVLAAFETVRDAIAG
ncbi:MAG: hypothetical protein ACO1OB_02735, partial [Archangium sp.]